MSVTPMRPMPCKAPNEPDVILIFGVEEPKKGGHKCTLLSWESGGIKAPIDPDFFKKMEFQGGDPTFAERMRFLDGTHRGEVVWVGGDDKIKFLADVDDKGEHISMTRTIGIGKVVLKTGGSEGFEAPMVPMATVNVTTGSGVTKTFKTFNWED